MEKERETRKYAKKPEILLINDKKLVLDGMCCKVLRQFCQSYSNHIESKQKKNTFS